MDRKFEQLKKKVRAKKCLYCNQPLTEDEINEGLQPFTKNIDLHLQMKGQIALVCDRCKAKIKSGEMKSLFDDIEDNLIKQTAKEIFNELEEYEKENIVKFPAVEFHFTFGLWIRNNYIHGHKKFEGYEPDIVSHRIIEEIQEMIKEEKSR